MIVYNFSISDVYKHTSDCITNNVILNLLSPLVHTNQLILKQPDKEDIEPGHSISFKITFAPCEYSD